jgi:hypothetical protein
MLIEEGEISEDILVQALRDGIRKGYFIESQLDRLDIKKETKDNLMRLLERT